MIEDLEEIISALRKVLGVPEPVCPVDHARTWASKDNAVMWTKGTTVGDHLRNNYFRTFVFTHCPLCGVPLAES